MKIILQNIKTPVLPPDEVEKFALASAAKILSRANVAFDGMWLSKRSVDARKREQIVFVCSVIADVRGTIPQEKLQRMGAVVWLEKPMEIVFGKTKVKDPPVVVGLGPCGMFAALLLAENGYRPIVIERGDDVSRRRQAVDRFIETGKLDTDSNIQFGAGGAGTFSDGKLVTRINDSLCNYVLSRFCDFGAPTEILYAAKPHIGTDLLLGIVDKICHRIEELGGKIYYRTSLEKIRTANGRAVAVITSAGEIACSSVVLAIGHSARDTYEALYGAGFSMESKPFSVGVRVEHLQSELNESMYGKFADQLPPAEYNLSHREGERGVYSFCMCPGGTVVAAASEENGVVTNGMSNYKRDGKNANAAIAVSVLPSDFGNGVLDGIAFQRSLERAAFAAGGKNYDAPVSTLGDFLSGKSGTMPTKVEPTYRGGDHYRPCDLHTVLPAFITKMLEIGFADFGRKIAGFDAPYAVLTGVETRTSSPLRILRNENMTAEGLLNVYPGGEGAGYAGGITSAAVDGIRTALSLMKEYAPLEKQ